MTDIDLTLLPDFLVEADEHLDEMESLLLKLAEEPDNTALLDDIFRPVHTIKGAAQFIGLDRVARLTHRLEDLLDLLRQGERRSSPEVVDLLIEARDRISQLAGELERTQAEASPVDDIVDRIVAEIEGREAAEAQAEAEEVPAEAPFEEEAGESYYQEKHDEELFGIFLEHLREKLALVRTQTMELEGSPNQLELLERCADSIRSLKSSANYMGYAELAGIDDSWLEDIAAAQAALAEGEAVPMAFMDGYLAEIADVFPQLAEPGMPTPVTEQPADEPEPAAAESEPTAPEIDLELLPDFLLEAGDHLDEMESLLLKLAEEPENSVLLDDIFRPVHTIKGAAQFIGLERVARLSHRLEDLLDLLRQGERRSSPETVDLLIEARDRIAQLSGELERTQAEASPVDDLVERITDLIDGKQVMEAPAVSPPKTEAPVESPYVEEHDKELFGIFLEHLREKLTLVRTQTVELADSTNRLELFERCAEAIRTLKSSANYMGYQELTGLYRGWLQDIEAALEIVPDASEAAPIDFMWAYLTEIAGIFPQLGEALLPAVVEKALASPSPGAEVAAGDEGEEVTDLFDRLSSALDAAAIQPAAEIETLHGVFEEMLTGREATPAAAEPPPAAKETPVPETPEESLRPEPSREERRVEEQRIKERRTGDGSEAGQRIFRKSIRVDSEKIDALMNQVGELVVDRSYFFQLYNDMRGLQQHLKDTLGLERKELKQVRAFTYRLSEAIAALGRTSNDIQEGVMKVRMLPISQLFNRYPRLVRDLTHNTAKEVDLELRGEDTELDKMVVEELSDPLIHIIRNAIDHGLESRQERLLAGKPEAGSLILDAYQESNHIVIEVMDDGRGIDVERIKVKALERGMASKEELDAMSSQELVRLITTAGFSTAEEVTGTSGRGVGMDVVKKNIEKLNGTLEIDSKAGAGTRIRLKIPLTLAIIPALQVRVGASLFTIPLANVEETLRVFDQETSVVEGTEVIHLRGRTLPIFRLSSLFSFEADSAGSNASFVVVVNIGEQQIGLVVDELMGQEEVVIKPLVDYLQENSGFSGATIKGDGRISLILDVRELADMAINRQIGRQRELTSRRRAGLREHTA